MRIITSALAAIAVIAILALSLLDTSLLNRIFVVLGCVGVALIVVAVSRSRRR